MSFVLVRVRERFSRNAAKNAKNTDGEGEGDPVPSLFRVVRAFRGSKLRFEEAVLLDPPEDVAPLRRCVRKNEEGRRQVSREAAKNAKGKEGAGFTIPQTSPFELVAVGVVLEAPHFIPQRWQPVLAEFSCLRPGLPTSPSCFSNSYPSGRKARAW